MALNALQDAYRMADLLKQKVGGAFSQLGTGVRSVQQQVQPLIQQSPIFHPQPLQFQPQAIQPRVQAVQQFVQPKLQQVQNFMQTNPIARIDQAIPQVRDQAVKQFTHSYFNPQAPDVINASDPFSAIGSAAGGFLPSVGAKIPLMVGIGAMTKLSKASKVLNPQVESRAIAAANGLRNYHEMLPAAQMQILTNARAVAQQIVPEILKSKVFRNMKMEEQIDFLGRVLEHRVEQSRNPKLNIGLTTEEFTKGKGSLQGELKAGTKSQLPTQGLGESALKAGSAVSSKDIVPQVSNSQSPFFNTNKLNISSGAKQKLNQVIQEVKPQIEKVVGSKLSNQQILDRAQVSSKILQSVVSKPQTEEFTTALLKARQKLANSASSGTVDQSYIDSLMTVKSHATDIARKLQSFNIGADPATSGAKDAILEAVLKVEQDSSKVLEAAKGVDFNDYNQVVDFYRKFIKPTKTEFIDTLRYNSMLSSPLTHINNAFSNLVNTGVVAPIEKTVTGTIDFLKSAVTGKPRTAFVGEGPAHVQGYVSNLGTAAHKFADTLRGKVQTGNVDIRQIPLATKGLSGKFVGKFTLPQRLLEASDQFFTELTKNAETASLNLKKSKGAFPGNVETQALNNAKYRLFRSDLHDPRQGHLLNSIDDLTAAIQKARTSGFEPLRTIANFTLPFVRTPMNILKQGIEYSPAGLGTIPGAANKTEQISKALIGTAAATATAMLVASGRTTWAEPTDQKKKAAFRDAGMQPYSIKIGDNWVAYDKLPPTFGFPLAFASALHDAQQNKLLNDSQVHMILSSVAKTTNYFSDQSYLKNIGDAVAASKGDIEGIGRLVSNYPQQLVPYRALLGWMARVTDPYQRKLNTTANYWDQQVQLLKQQIPILSQTTEARTNALGEPIPNQNRVMNAFSPFKVKQENPQKKEYYNLLNQQSQNTKNINQIKGMLEQGQNPNMNFGEQAQAAEAQQANPKEAMQQKLLDDVAKQKVKITGQPIEQNGKIYYQIGSAVRVFDIGQPLQEPTLSGQKEIDKKAVSDYNSLITQKMNGIHDMITIGKLTQDQGEQLLEALRQRRDTFKTQNKPQYQFTGNPIVDKYVASKQSADVTSQINAVVGQIQDGTISADQGAQQIQALKSQQQTIKTRGGKKPKAVKYRVSGVRPRTTSGGTSIKAPKIRLPKVQRIKVRRKK